MEGLRRYGRSPSGVLRAVIVALIAAFALATSLPNLIYFIVPLYGGFGFQNGNDNRVDYSTPDVVRAGIRVGDLIDYRTTPADQRYVLPNFRFAPLGVKATFRVVRGGVEHDVTLRAKDPSTHWGSGGVLLEFVLKKIATLFLVLAGVVLVLVRPTRLTSAFFLYAVGSTHANPEFWSFLPAAWFVAVQSVYEVLNAAGQIGFLMVALRLPRDPPVGWRAALNRVAPHLLIAIALLAIAADIEAELLVGPWAARLLDSEDLVAAIIFTLGAAALFATLLERKAGLNRPTRWVIAGLVLAAAGQLTSIAVNSSLSVVPLPPPVYEAGWVFNVIASLATAYVIVRYRVVDVRFVVDRSAAYGALALAIIGASAALNWAFAKQWAQIAWIIPLEIIAAVALGYRLSGLADVAAALTLAGAEASAALLAGRRAEQREILAKAIGRAEQTHRTGILAEVRARAAFAAWTAGEDEEFERHIVALEGLLGDSRVRGLGFFLLGARGRIAEGAPTHSDLPDWVARAYLLASATTDDASMAGQYAVAALNAADRSATSYISVLARIAAAEFLPQQRAELYATALAQSDLTRSLPLQQAVSALQRGLPDVGLLAPFLARLRMPRVTKPVLEVHFLTASVRRMGNEVALRDAERALLFAIAHDRASVATETLTDKLWPDLDGDAAKNAFRVCLHRLRRGLGDAQSIVRLGRAYHLAPGAVVDLHFFRGLLRSSSALPPLARDERTKLHEAFEKIVATRTERARQAGWFSLYRLEIAELGREIALIVGRDAIGRGDATAAIGCGRVILEDDPHDADACEIVIRALLAIGDRPAAMREYQKFKQFMLKADQPQACQVIEGLLCAKPAPSPNSNRVIIKTNSQS